MASTDLGGVAGAGGGGVSQTLSGVDGIDTLANLTALPREEGKLYYATDIDNLYTDDGTSLNPVGGGALTLSAVDTHRRVEILTLNGADLIAKNKTLGFTPNTPSKTVLTPLGGIDAEYGVDYTVVGNTVDWNGLTFDGLLANGDKLIVVYRTI